MKDLFRRRNRKENKTMSNEELKPGEEHGQERAASAMEAMEHSADTAAGSGSENDAPMSGDVPALQAELEILRTEHQALHDKHLRLFAEFDNFRKRTARERLELIQHAGENTLKTILPVLDDMDRAVTNNEKIEDPSAMKEGMKLIHQKMVHLLGSLGLKPMEVRVGDAFDTDKHEAITKAPAPSPKMKGAVIDVIENGYMLQDKVIRFAKVVVGE